MNQVDSRRSHRAVHAMRIGVAGMFAAVSIVFADATARATVLRHASLVRSEPAADSLLPLGLANFRLVFSEPITPALSGASLIAPDGRTIPLATTGDPRDVHALMAPVPALDPGAWKLAWRIVSADGHPVKGTLAFRVPDRAPVDTVRPSPVPTPAPRPAPSEARSSPTPDDAAAGPTVAGAPLIPAILRGTGVGALMALAGLLAFASWLAPEPADRYRRLGRWLAIAAPVLLTGHLLAWLVNISPTHSLDSAGMTTFSTSLGRVELLRVALAWLALWAFALARRERLAMLFAMGALIVSGAIGHPAAIAPAWAIPGKIVHLIGAALWLGGLLWLATTDRVNPSAFARGAARVSSIALWAMIAVAFSGIVETRLFLAHVDDLYRSAYGIGVLAKVAGLLILVLFGAHHRYRVMPKLTESADCVRMADSVTREVAVMAIVVLLGGVLAYIPPPAAQPTSAASTSTVTPAP